MTIFTMNTKIIEEILRKRAIDACQRAFYVAISVSLIR